MSNYQALLIRAFDNVVESVIELDDEIQQDPRRAFSAPTGYFVANAPGRPGDIWDGTKANAPQEDPHDA